MSGPVPGRGPVRLGEVSSFDDARGTGTVRDGGTGEEIPFHCTEISDGTRTIAGGARVAFLRKPAHGGAFEARAIVKLP